MGTAEGVEVEDWVVLEEVGDTEELELEADLLVILEEDPLESDAFVVEDLLELRSVDEDLLLVVVCTEG